MNWSAGVAVILDSQIVGVYHYRPNGGTMLASPFSPAEQQLMFSLHKFTVGLYVEGRCLRALLQASARPAVRRAAWLPMPINAVAGNSAYSRKLLVSILRTVSVTQNRSLLNTRSPFRQIKHDDEKNALGKDCEIMARSHMTMK
jgi:hypothetical protein